MQSANAANRIACLLRRGIGFGESRLEADRDEGQVHGTSQLHVQFQQGNFGWRNVAFDDEVFFDDVFAVKSARRADATEMCRSCQLGAGNEQARLVAYGR